MQTLLSQPAERPKPTFRNMLSAVAAIVAFVLCVYSAIVFPAAHVSKDLQLTSSALLILSLVARAPWRKSPH